MATYKKRGNKVRNSKVKDDGSYLEDVKFDGESTTQEVFDSLDETASRSEQWLEKNAKMVYTVLGVLLIGMLAFLAYNKFVKEPKEVKAANYLAYSKSAFNEAENAAKNIDSLYNIALNGVNNNYGLLEVASKFSGTKAGNLANYMAGMSYLKMNEYDKAVEFLSKFSSEDEILDPMAKGKIGDAFADINQLEDALTYYTKAATVRNNSLTTPLYLFKAANTALDLGKFDQALKMFIQIQTDYPKSDEAKDIQMYINRAKYATK
jgi:tetratricopeptide (TPR) repeat protein